MKRAAAWQAGGLCVALVFLGTTMGLDLGMGLLGSVLVIAGVALMRGPSDERALQLVPVRANRHRDLRRH